MKERYFILPSLINKFKKNYLKKNPNIFIVICLFYVMIVCAQELDLDQISTKDGLSQNSITCIAQDSIGFLWFGSYNGLNRYDGYEYKKYKHDPHNINSISHNYIRRIQVDKMGNLWIGTVGGGLNFYNQEKEIFRSFQVNPKDSASISNNSVSSLLIDNQDNLWIGTTIGGVNILSLSDFYADIKSNRPQIKFKHFRYKDVGLSHIAWDRITSLHKDQNGYIWIGTRYGLSRYNSSTNEFKHFFSIADDPNTLIDNNINAISEDKYGNIWIGNWTEGLSKYIKTEGKFVRYPFRKNKENSPSYNMIMTLYKDRSQELWIGTWGGGINKLVTFDIDNGYLKNKFTDKFIHYTNNPKEQTSISNLCIYSIYEDKFGIHWIGTDWDGLYKNIGENQKFTCYQSGTSQNITLNDNGVFCIHKDHTGLLWIGTRQGGINLIDLNKKQSRIFMNHPENPYSLVNNSVRVIFEDRQNRIWIGTEIGLNLYMPKDKSFKRYILDKEYPDGTNIFCIQDDKYGNLWIGTYGLGLYRLNLSDNKITHYEFDPNNPNSLGDNIIWRIHEDRNDNLWIATDNSGLNIYDRTKDIFIKHKFDATNTNSLSGNKIHSIFEDKSGQMWFGTTTGLNKLMPFDDINSPLSFTHYTSYEGLPTNTIHGILEDDKENLWISTNNGLSLFAKKTGIFTNFDVNDGLQDKEFMVNSCFKDTVTGELYFGGVNGFNVFHPDSIRYEKTLPEVVITGLKILNQPVHVNSRINDRIVLRQSILKTKEIYLTHKHISFSITFSALHFINPMSNLYAYKLDGFEKNWNYVNASQRTATYTNLDPGVYTFRVKASNNDNIWNEKERILRIIITPPFWLTWWFRILLVGIIILFIMLFFQIRTVQIRKRNKKLAEINTKLNKEIKERHRAENKIKSLNKELEERVKHRTEEIESFAYSISHDLRTPLRGIQGFSLSLLEDYEDKFEEKGKNYLNRIIKATKYMSELIDDLLILSRVTRKEPIKEEIDLAIIFEDIIKNINDTHPERDIKFIYKKGLVAICDKNLMKLAIENLVSNALKFTRNQKISEIEFGRFNRKKKQIFYIRDNGVGFDMKYANKLFEAFQRLQTDYDGTGIGLTTVQRIIQRHGGKVWAEGKVNKGATFFFTLS